MVSINHMNVWIILLIIKQISAVPYNQPKFSQCATWSTNGTTFANITTVGSQPYGIYINSNNTIYVADQMNNRIQIWLNNSTNLTKTISGNLSMPYSIFATINGDMYIDNGINASSCIAKRTSNANTSGIAMYVGQKCFGIFIDINNTLYCSMRNVHQVVARSLNSVTDILTVVAGIGCPGSSSDMLNLPSGIFVDINFDLYVADCGNDRIQLFQSDPLNGTTLSIDGIAGTIPLNCPTGIVLDGDDYLYIVDSGNQRILASGPAGFLCIIGCSGTSGSASNQLNTPWSMSFDSYGNIFVTDHGNSRIQKFILATNSCVCRPPTVILIPGTSTLSSPIQFRRAQDFYIVSIIELNCNQSSSTTTQWIVKNCTSICSNQILLGQTITTTLSELYIPARTLAYGTYQLNLIVTMTMFPLLTTTSSVYVSITASGITANLVQLGTSMVTSGYDQNLKLDPGTYSVNPDESVFNGSDWKYDYYCRIYGLYMFPNIQGSLLTIDDPRIDPSNPSCLSNRTDNQTGWQFGNSIESSVTILGKSLQSNRTYQFMVYMQNLRNSSIQATGYVLVTVVDTSPQMIVIGCVISVMCVPNLEFQLLNPTTQVALFAICVGNCSTLQSIQWNIYNGSTTPASNFTQWTLFNQTNAYQNIWFFGTTTSNFTAANQLFLSNPQVDLWRFEVVYSFISEKSSSALNFVINQPPCNGSCSINPLNGTTTDPFTISCPNWVDQDGIQDYSLYTWTTDSSQKTMTAFSPGSIFQVRLPAGDDSTSILNLIVVIRDQLDCTTQYNLSFVFVTPDSAGINNLINDIQGSTNGLANNPIVQLLASGNQNIVGQVLASLSQQFNKMNSQSLDKAVSGGIPAASISVSPLGSPGTSEVLPLNQSALIEFNNALNSQANVREYVTTFTSNLPITTSNSIILQSSSLAQLTKATNQLTRTTLTIASNRCYQLAMALSSMLTMIAYEDAQTAATQLLQCATNVLSAVNGPLQQRTNTLESDSSSAEAFPDDYETDIEFEWSDIRLFVDGNDFSIESIDKARNIYYQKQLATQISNQANQIISLLTSTLNIHLNIGQNTAMNTSQVFMSLETSSIESLSNKQIQQVANAQIQLPTNLQTNLNQHSTISIRSMMQPLASFGNSKSSSNTNLSTSISLTILDQNQNEVSIGTNMSQSINIFIPRDPNRIIPAMILQNVTSTNATPHNQLFQLQYLNITSDLSISVHFEIEPLNSSVAYLFIYKFDQIPQLNSSINQIDGWTIFCHQSMYTYFLDNQQTFTHQSLIFGLRELNSTEIIEFCSNSSFNNPPITDQRFNFTSDYQLRIYTSGCYYLNSNNQWKSDGLRVGSLTNHNQTQCYSNHLTTFAGAFLVLPDPINWNYVFSHANFMQNKTIYLTIICISIIYLILMIYARWNDRKDLEKLGVTALPDNHQSDEYFYQILVFTGQRKGAGTKSNVHFILSGEKDETHIRTLADPHRPILQRGGIDAFIMAVPKSLGLLNCIRIWHDNTGQGSSSSWFLKYIIIRDLQTMEKFHFISQQWFAVEKDDGKIERVIPVAGIIEKSEFSYLLSKQTYHSVSDGHLWFSIFSRPPSNQFTRVQRCTCCFVLLFLSMFLSIMYYDSQKETNNVSVGSFHITTEQIGVGVIVELLSLIPSLLLVQIFRRLRSRQESISPLRRTLYQIKESLNRENEEKRRSEKRLPWWFIFIAYGLSVILAGISIFFIIVRGIQFGDLKTQQWLISILSGFFSSIFLTQPLKILCLAIFFISFCPKTDDDKEANEYLDEHRIELDPDEEYLHLTKNHSLFIYRPTTRTNRLNEAEVVCARHQRLKEIHMWSIIRETFIYLLFLSCLFILTYSNQNSNSFYQVDHLTKYFHNSRQINLDYTKISTINEYWKWLEESFVSNIRAQQWYNGASPRNLSGFINDKTNRMIGWATMRQLRIKSQLCSIKILNSTCEYDYSFSNEEKNSFEPGWENETQIRLNSTIEQAFQYKSSDELDTYVYQGYSGGGYVYEFRGLLADIQSNLSELYQLSWIDQRTRAIIIQLNLYNPNVQLFTSVTLLTEFSSNGGVYPQSQFEPMNFYAFTSILQLVCTIIYMIFIIYFMLMEIRLFFRLKLNYIYEFWSLIEVGIIICSWMGVGIYVWRYHECSRIGQLFKTTNGYVYINLQLASYVNEFLGFLYGFCCFFGTIKLIRLCRFNQSIYLFIQILHQAAKELISFGIMFSIVYFAFLCLFYLLFQSKVPYCSTVLQTAEMLFQMTALRFNAYQLTEAAAFLGPFSFSLFIFLVVFVCMSMVISIVNQNFHQVRENHQHGNDPEIYSFIFERFLRWTGLKKRSEIEIHEERDALMRSEYYDPIERFPEKMDKLLDALNRLYMSQRNGSSSI